MTVDMQHHVVGVIGEATTFSKKNMLHAGQGSNRQSRAGRNREVKQHVESIVLWTIFHFTCQESASLILSCLFLTTHTLMHMHTHMLTHILMHLTY